MPRDYGERACAECGDTFRARTPKQRFCPKSARDASGEPKNCRWKAWEREHPRAPPKPKRKPRVETRTGKFVSVRIRREIVDAYRIEGETPSETVRRLIFLAVARRTQTKRVSTEAIGRPRPSASTQDPR